MNVEELLQSKHIYYKSSSKDFVVNCMNPEHEDKNPSMRIDKATGIFSCLSCGYSGNIYKLFGINDKKLLNIKVEQILNKIKSMNIKPLELPSDSVLFNKEYRNISAKTYKSIGAFTTNSIDGMENRIVFPIKNIKGEIIIFIGRSLYNDFDPKYKIYPKDAQLSMYPLQPKIIDGSIILVEGIFDYLNLLDKGLTNVVCIFGLGLANAKRQRQKRNLEKLLFFKIQGVHTIYTLFDGDAPGREAAENFRNFASSEFYVDSVDLPDGMDPGSMSKHDVDKLIGILYDKNSTS